MNRRSFLTALAAAFVADPEKLLWVPGAKTISIPSPAICNLRKIMFTHDEDLTPAFFEGLRAIGVNVKTVHWMKDGWPHPNVIDPSIPLYISLAEAKLTPDAERKLDRRVLQGDWQTRIVPGPSRPSWRFTPAGKELSGRRNLYV